MIPTQEMTPYPVFGDNATKVQPDDPKYSGGFLPGDVLPAEWLNWLLNRASGAVTKLNAGTLSLEQEVNEVLRQGSQVPDAGQTNQLAAAIVQLITEAILAEQQRTPVGVPTLWFGPKPDWALDFGNGAATKYLWANYPKLNTNKFKSILSTLSTNGWMTAYDAEGFYVPDLRGIVPIGYGTNAKRTGETYSGGALSQFLASQNQYHDHSSAATFAGTYAYIGAIADTFRPENVYADTYIICSLQRSGRHTDTSSGNNRYFQFYFTPSGTVTPTVYYSGVEKQASKPATIGVMWIVRYE